MLGEERVVVYDMPGTTRDSIYIPMVRDEREYVLIDTAGVRKRGKVTETVEKFSVIKTLQAIEDANVVLLVIDAREGISDQDLSLLGFILNSGRSLVIAVNKWDGMSEDREHVKRCSTCVWASLTSRVHFISALHGSGVGNLFESVQEAYECATRRVNTSMLTKIMQMAVDDHQPPLVRGRRVKLKYAHAGGYNPPIVVIHGNQVSDLADSVQTLPDELLPPLAECDGDADPHPGSRGRQPFAGKRNLLTPTQMRKRKRLMSHLKRASNRSRGRGSDAAPLFIGPKSFYYLKITSPD
ncbi:50S ribosome-binding GTPase [Serratia ureilytica]